MAEDGVRFALGKQLERRRVALGKTRQDVERDAGIGAGLLSRAETGQSLPTVETLVVLCVVLDCVFHITKKGIELIPL